MHLKTLLAGLSLRSATADMETEITHISYDSRTTAPGDVFVAMTGFATDGHAYIGKAVAAGAAAVVCERPPEDSSVPYVLVENSRRALAVMAANYYGHPADSMTMVAVTGTNGKTTTTYLLKAILEQELGAKVGLIGTNQDLIGDEVVPTERTTPESLELQELFARMRSAGCTHVVMEASSHALALDRVYGIHYAVGISTRPWKPTATPRPSCSRTATWASATPTIPGQSGCCKTPHVGSTSMQSTPRQTCGRSISPLRRTTSPSMR